jgi:DNA-binding response OmpR family regulator
MLKVMLIEDDQTMVSLLTMLLNLEGYLVKTPTNNQMDGILNDVLRERPHIALVDVNLEEGNGLDLLREIRQAPTIMGTRVIMFSGLNLQEECIQAGADGFIQKPFIPDELIKLIHVSSEQNI